MTALDLPHPFALHLLSSLRARLARAWRDRRERAELLSLTERELKDIGITRYDALMAAHRRFPD